MTGFETTSKFSPVKLSVIPPLEWGGGGGGGGGEGRRGGRVDGVRREGGCVRVCVCERVAYAGMVF